MTDLSLTPARHSSQDPASLAAWQGDFGGPTGDAAVRWMCAHQEPFPDPDTPRVDRRDRILPLASFPTLPSAGSLCLSHLTPRYIAFLHLYSV